MTTVIWRDEMMSYVGGTALGLKFKDGVILAADKTYILGNMVFSTEVRKVFPLADYVGVAAAGLVADMQELFKEIKWHINLRSKQIGKRVDIRSIAKLTSVIMYSRRMFPYYTQILIGGYLENPELYSLDSLGSLIGDDYVAIGTGSENVIGILDSEYKSDLEFEEAKELVRRSFKAAIRRDVLSGRSMDMLIIRKEGYEILTESFI
jgi:proteasome beta subunit